jgi:hypothetical protein
MERLSNVRCSMCLLISKEINKQMECLQNVRCSMCLLISKEINKQMERNVIHLVYQDEQ